MSASLYCLVEFGELYLYYNITHIFIYMKTTEHLKNILMP